MKRNWITTTFIALTAVSSFVAIAAPRTAQADDVDDQLKKMKEQMECRSRCNDESLKCMARCPNGNPGASCRASCLLDANSCSNRCN
jgi:hypothetical protein